MGCTSHHIREEDIYKAVFSAINSYCMNFADLADKIDGVSGRGYDRCSYEELEGIMSAKQEEIDDLVPTIEIVESRCLNELESKESTNEICNDIRASINNLEREMSILWWKKRTIFKKK